MTDSPKTVTYYRMMYVRIAFQEGGASLEIEAPAWDIDLNAANDMPFLLRVVELNFDIHLSKLHVADSVTGKAMKGIVFDRTMIENSVPGQADEDSEGFIFRSMTLYQTAEEAMDRVADEMQAVDNLIEAQCQQRRKALRKHEGNFSALYLEAPCPNVLSIDSGWDQPKN